MRNITNDLDALGESLLWSKLHRIRYLLCLMLCVIAISLTVIATPADLVFGSFYFFNVSAKTEAVENPAEQNLVLIEFCLESK